MRFAFVALWALSALLLLQQVHAAAVERRNVLKLSRDASVQSSAASDAAAAAGAGAAAGMSTLSHPDVVALPLTKNVYKYTKRVFNTAANAWEEHSVPGRGLGSGALARQRTAQREERARKRAGSRSEHLDSTAASVTAPITGCPQFDFSTLVRPYIHTAADATRAASYDSRASLLICADVRLLSCLLSSPPLLSPRSLLVNR
jgi:hypothetical protein